MHIKDFDMLRPGDRVRIVSERAHNGAWPKDDAIDEWLGKVMTVKSVEWGSVRMIEDQGEHGGWGYLWTPEMIDCVVDKNNAPDVSAIYPAIEIISEHIRDIINVLTDLANRLDKINKE